MRITVIGAGAVGGYLGLKLIEAGHEVAFLTTPRHVQPLRDNGLTLLTQNGVERTTDFSVSADPADLAPAHVVFCTTKIYHLPEVLPQLPQLLTDGGLVVTAQNGISAAPMVAGAVGDRRAVPGLIQIVANMESPGVIRQFGSGVRLVCGDKTLAGTPATDRLGPVVHGLQDSGLSASLSADIHHEIWMKFALITTFGGACGLTGTGIGPVRSHPATRELQWCLLREAQQVASSFDVELSAGDLETIMTRLDRAPDFATTSMLRDIEAGRPNELDALNGTLAREGKSRGIQVPINQTVVAVLSERAARIRKDAGDPRRTE